MKLLFWLCFVVVVYAYLGYAICLWICSRLRTKQVLQMGIRPSVSIVIAAKNEEANLPAKLESLGHLDYPSDLLQVVIASDGSTDGTVRILREHEAGIVPVILDESKGKAFALNRAVEQATGEILV